MLASVGSLLLASVAGCSTLPSNLDRVASTALADTAATPLAEVAAASMAGSDAFGSVASDVASRPRSGDGPAPEMSGFQLVSAGEEAFGTLYTLITRAQRSLDLQYYIVADDPYAHTLLRAAREAAARGVRVRLLVDDFYTTGMDDRIAWYAAHPNIQVRVFNPFAFGRTWFATRLIASITDVDRINRRMHNKLFIADNALAVTGGRNVGAAYYAHSERTNFLDLDVLAAGPVVKDLSGTFDRYWNSGFSYPIERFAGASESSRDTVDERALTDVDDPVIAATAEARRQGDAFAAQLDTGRLRLDHAPADLIADRPSKIHRTRPRVGRDGAIDGGATIASDLLAIIATTQRELIIVSPYFVPGERGTAALRALVERGVQVRVVTNSLASTDAAIVHVGYARYRERLLAMGVTISELRPEPGKGARFTGLGSSKASLHAKVLLVDRTTLFIGSFNVDQRSSLENTEMGLEIESRELATQVVDILRDRESSTYRVAIADDNGLQWTTRIDGMEHVYRDEPEAGALLKGWLRVLACFAPEEML